MWFFGGGGWMDGNAEFVKDGIEQDSDNSLKKIPTNLLHFS